MDSRRIMVQAKHLTASSPGVAEYRWSQDYYDSRAEALDRVRQLMRCGEVEEITVKHEETRMTEDHGPCEILPRGSTLEQQAQRDADGNYRKSGVVFEDRPRPAVCQSPATTGSIIPPQMQHLADEVSRLTAEVFDTQAMLGHERDLVGKLLARVNELTAGNATLRAELEGTNSFSGNPHDWGLRAVADGLREQRDAAIAERDRQRENARGTLRTLGAPADDHPDPVFALCVQAIGLKGNNERLARLLATPGHLRSDALMVDSPKGKVS